MTHIYYITYSDISISCDAHGVFTFDTEKILTNIARKYYTMPKWIRSDVEKLFNDGVLSKAVSREDIRKIINGKLVEVNNIVVPVARLNKLNVSECPDWLKVPKFIDHGDINISTFPTYRPDGSIDIQLKIDYKQLMRKVTDNDRIDIDTDSIEKLINMINLYLTGDKSLDYINPVDSIALNAQVEVYKESVLNIVNNFISRFAEPLIISDMKDSVGLNPYFAYDLEGKKISYTGDRVLHLLDAMDYTAVDNPDEFLTYIENHCMELEEEMEAALVSIPEDSYDSYLEENITMSVNLAMLNRLLFVRNNEIRLSDAVGLVYPSVVISQLDVEMFYVDACTGMMVYDTVLDDISSDLKLKKSDLREDVEELISEVKNTYTLLRDKEESLDIIYKGVRSTYFDMYGRLHDKHTRTSNGIKKDNSAYRYKLKN